MTEVFEFALNRLVTIKFTVDDDASTPILAHDRLISRSQIDDAKACMAKAHTPVFRNPVSLTIGSTMKKAMGSPMQRCFRYGKAAREKCYDSAHYCYSIRCEAQRIPDLREKYQHLLPNGVATNRAPTAFVELLKIHSEASLLQPNELHCSRPSLRRSLKLSKGCQNVAPKVVKD